MKKQLLTALFIFITIFIHAQQKYNLLWEITGNGLKQPSYIFGTVHENKKDVFNFPDSFFVCLDKCEAVATEIDPYLLYEFMEAPDDVYNFDCYKDLLSKKSYEELLTTCRVNTEMEWGELSNKTPMSILRFVQSTLMRGKYYEDDIYYHNRGNRDVNKPTFLLYTSLDNFIDEYGMFKGKKVRFVETPLDRNRIDLAYMVNADKLGYYFDVNNNDGNNGRLVIKTKGETCLASQLEDAYFDGDLEKIGELDRDCMDSLYMHYKLKERNKIMVHNIDSLVRSHSTFIAVGCSHLAGNGSLVELLNKLGYKTRAVTATFETSNLPEIKRPDIPWLDFTDDEGYFSYKLMGKIVNLNKRKQYAQSQVSYYDYYYFPRNEVYEIRKFRTAFSIKNKELLPYFFNKGIFAAYPQWNQKYSITLDSLSNPDFWIYTMTDSDNKISKFFCSEHEYFFVETSGSEFNQVFVNSFKPLKKWMPSAYDKSMRYEVVNQVLGIAFTAPTKTNSIRFRKKTKYVAGEDSPLLYEVNVEDFKYKDEDDKIRELSGRLKYGLENAVLDTVMFGKNKFYRMAQKLDENYSLEDYIYFKEEKLVCFRVLNHKDDELVGELIVEMLTSFKNIPQTPERMRFYKNENENFSVSIPEKLSYFSTDKPSTKFRNLSGDFCLSIKSKVSHNAFSYATYTPAELLSFKTPKDFVEFFLGKDSVFSSNSNICFKDFEDAIMRGCIFGDVNTGTEVLRNDSILHIVFYNRFLKKTQKVKGEIISNGSKIYVIQACYEPLHEAEALSCLNDFKLLTAKVVGAQSLLVEKSFLAKEKLESNDLKAASNALESIEMLPQNDETYKQGAEVMFRVLDFLTVSGDDDSSGIAFPYSFIPRLIKHEAEKGDFSMTKNLFFKAKKYKYYDSIHDKLMDGLNYEGSKQSLDLLFDLYKQTNYMDDGYFFPLDSFAKYDDRFMAYLPQLSTLFLEHEHYMRGFLKVLVNKSDKDISFGNRVEPNLIEIARKSYQADWEEINDRSQEDPKGSFMMLLDVLSRGAYRDEVCAVIKKRMDGAHEVRLFPYLFEILLRYAPEKLTKSDWKRLTKNEMSYYFLIYQCYKDGITDKIPPKKLNQQKYFEGLLMSKNEIPEYMYSTQKDKVATVVYYKDVVWEDKLLNRKRTVHVYKVVIDKGVTDEELENVKRQKEEYEKRQEALKKEIEKLPKGMARYEDQRDRLSYSGHDYKYEIKMGFIFDVPKKGVFLYDPEHSPISGLKLWHRLKLQDYEKIKVSDDVLVDMLSNMNLDYKK